MGRNNQQRRAAKKRKQHARSRPRPADRPRHTAPPGEEGRPSPPSPEELLRAAVASWSGEPARFSAALAALSDQARIALPVAETMLDAALDQQWQQGWTPADLLHAIARHLTGAHVAVAVERIVLDGRRRVQRGQTMHPRWRAQLDGLARRATRVDPPDLGARVRRTVEVLALLARLAALPRTLPPPGESPDASRVAGGHLDGAMLERVRALLAKAESTDFEHEAEAFTAKAQELIARHAIDEALLQSADDVGDPAVRRLHVEDPYAEAKASLVAEVASANRCRTVYSPDCRWVTVFGYEHDLDAVELLSVSLLAQATSAMARHGTRRDGAGRSRTRSFRRAFLLGFGGRIGERLRRANDGQVATSADADPRLLPVLAAREDRLAAAQRRVFPRLVQRTTSSSNGVGWLEGRAAAEVADLDVAAAPPAP